MRQLYNAIINDISKLILDYKDYSKYITGYLVMLFIYLLSLFMIPYLSKSTVVLPPIIMFIMASIIGYIQYVIIKNRQVIIDSSSGLKKKIAGGL